MLAAANAPDTTVIAAFAVGVASFVSPCVLPLVPGYLSAVSGVSISEFRAGEQGLRRVLVPSLFFCLAFTIVFVLLGMSATGIGSLLQDHRDLLNKVAGGLIVALGIFFLATPFVPKLNREWHPEALMSRAGSGGPLVAGAAFAIAWTPCVGPTLGSILTAAATTSSRYHGGVLLAFYSAGLAIPFLATALAFGRMTAAFARIKRHFPVIIAAGGIVLIAMGVLIFTDELTRLNSDAQKLLAKLGLDFVYSL